MGEINSETFENIAENLPSESSVGLLNDYGKELDMEEVEDFPENESESNKPKVWEGESNLPKISEKAVETVNCSILVNFL